VLQKLAPTTQLTIKIVYPSAKRYPRHFDAVVVYHFEASEVNFVKDEVERYKDAPIKVFLGKEAYGGASAEHGVAFTHDKVAELYTHVIAELGKLRAVIKNVFIAFDKDGSGYIEPNELKAVSKELGRELDASELENCVKDLDCNKDGKISLEEFTSWWLSGRQGLSNIMRKLLAFKIQALKFADHITGTLKEIVNDGAVTNDVSTSQLTININQVE
jgi:hypothetical protein